MSKPTKDSYTPKKKKRKENSRLVFPSRYLIICEGIKTEPQYFGGLKNHMKKLYGDRIKIEVDIMGTGKNTTGILKKAKELVEAQSELNPYEKVWLVYDKDDFPKRNFNQVANWVNQRNNNGTNNNPQYNVAWSNECIELWFLLHYEYLSSQIKRKKYYKSLVLTFYNITRASTEKTILKYLVLCMKQEISSQLFIMQNS